jgi:hypothetical protein
MCVPEITIRPDGKGFVVRKGGIDWKIMTNPRGVFFAAADVNGDYIFSSPSMKIMEAVDSALAKVSSDKK